MMISVQHKEVNLRLFTYRIAQSVAETARSLHLIFGEVPRTREPRVPEPRDIARRHTHFDH